MEIRHVVNEGFFIFGENGDELAKLTYRKEGEKQGFGCGRQCKSSHTTSAGRAVAFPKMQECFCGNQGAFGRGRAVGAGGPKSGGCHSTGCG